MRLTFCCAALLALAGCSGIPDLDNRVSASARAAGFPEIVPLEGLLNGADATSITPETTAGLASGLAGLRTRAARLQRPVIEPAVRARMLAALRRRASDRAR